MLGVIGLRMVTLLRVGPIWVPLSMRPISSVVQNSAWAGGRFEDGWDCWAERSRRRVILTIPNLLGGRAG